MVLIEKSPRALEGEARQLQNYAVFIKDPVLYGETLEKIRGLLDEAARLRGPAGLVDA